MPSKIAVFLPKLFQRKPEQEAKKSQPIIFKKRLLTEFLQEKKQNNAEKPVAKEEIRIALVPKQTVFGSDDSTLENTRGPAPLLSHHNKKYLSDIALSGGERGDRAVHLLMKGECFKEICHLIKTTNDVLLMLKLLNYLSANDRKDLLLELVKNSDAKIANLAEKVLSVTSDE